MRATPYNPMGPPGGSLAPSCLVHALNGHILALNGLAVEKFLLDNRGGVFFIGAM